MIKGLRGATIWSEDLNNLLPGAPAQPGAAPAALEGVRR